MAQIRKAQEFFSWIIIASEMSHVFCCVLPTIFSVLTLLVGIGLIGAMPVWMEGMHGFMHSYEIPLMIMSGCVVLAGWGIHYAAMKIDCHDTGCGHGGCRKKKKKALTILKIATFLLVCNALVYIAVHRNPAFNQMVSEVSHASHVEQHDDHHH